MVWVTVSDSFFIIATFDYIQFVRLFQRIFASKFMTDMGVYFFNVRFKVFYLYIF